MHVAKITRTFFQTFCFLISFLRVLKLTSQVHAKDTQISFRIEKKGKVEQLQHQMLTSDGTVDGKCVEEIEESDRLLLSNNRVCCYGRQRRFVPSVVTVN